MASDYSLYADLGNTNLHVGLYQRRWRAETRFEVAALAEAAHWDAALNEVIAGATRPGAECRSAVACASGERVHELLAAIERVTGVAPHLVGPELTRRIRFVYDPPESLGRDRILAAIAARKSYGVPVIVLDVGTFITCDLVDEDGEMIPIAIAPGLPVVLEGGCSVGPGLADRLKLAFRALPLAARVPAGSTAESLANGLYAYLAGTLGQLVEYARLYARSEDPVPVVVTGGDAFPAQEAMEQETRWDPDLVLDGLRLVDPARKH